MSNDNLKLHVDVINDIRSMQGAVVSWADGVLGERDPRKTAMKLTAEAMEVLESVSYLEKQCTAGELADVLILLVDLAHLEGIDLAEAFWSKMSVNAKRRWDVGPGCIKHLKE